jgi:hypothetical protein
MNRDCGPGQRCFIEQDGTGTCSLDVETGCSSDPSAHPCACNLACREDQCVTTCVHANDCAADGVCRPDLTNAGTFCFALSGPPMDAGTIDAASDAAHIDAPTIDAGADASGVDAPTSDASVDASVDASATDAGGGCTGLCARIPNCATGTTTISGVVTAPGSGDPLPNALVYIPNGGPPAIADGLQCSQCVAPSSPF